MYLALLFLVAVSAQDSLECVDRLARFTALGTNCSNAYFESNQKAPREACDGPCEAVMYAIRTDRKNLQQCLDRSAEGKSAKEAIRIKATLVASSRFLNVMCSTNKRGDYCAPLQSGCAPYSTDTPAIATPICPANQRDVDAMEYRTGCCAGSWIEVVRLMRDIQGDAACERFEYIQPCKAPRWDLAASGSGNGNGNGNRSVIGFGAGLGGLAAVTALGLRFRRKKSTTESANPPEMHAISV